jgi:nitronate monooxygenase
MTTLQQLLGTELPLIQAPMAGIQGSAMAIAVSNAGGLGSLPCAMLGNDAIRSEIGAIRAGTGKPYNVNFFCHVSPQPSAEREDIWRNALAPYYREHGIDAASIPTGPGRNPFSEAVAEVLAEFRPPVVSFHFGLPPEPLLAQVRGWGSKILASATTVDEALWLEAEGVDAVIAQGLEAGGHRGHFLSFDLTAQLGTFALLPQVVRAVRLPVIAAGGIADAKGVAAAMVHDAARHTALTNLFTGRPARGIMNRLMRELGPIAAVAPEFPLATSGIAPLRAKAEAQGLGDFSPLWSGQNATGCSELPAAEITRALAHGFHLAA